MLEGVANADGSKIEVTPAMIEAGAVEMRYFDPQDDNIRDWLDDVYRAMERARLGRVLLEQLPG